MQPLLKIVLTWIVALAVGMALRELLSGNGGLSIHRGYTMYVLPWNRLAFWIAIFTASVLTATAAWKIMWRDLGL